MADLSGVGAVVDQVLERAHATVADAGVQTGESLLVASRQVGARLQQRVCNRATHQTRHEMAKPTRLATRWQNPPDSP